MKSMKSVFCTCLLLALSCGSSVEQTEDIKKRNAEYTRRLQQGIERCVELGGVPIRGSWYGSHMTDCRFPPDPCK